MTQEELREYARRQPFEPFRLILTTGETFDIHHPDLIMVGRRSAIIGMSNDPGGMVYDRTLKVDLLHVVGVQDLPAPPPTNGPAGGTTGGP